MVDVVIPTKNRAKMLRQCLESVDIQGNVVGKVFVIDQRSDDATPQVVEEFGNKIVFVSEDFKNPSQMRNYGIKKSNAEFIALLDSDDFWLEKKLELQVKLLNENTQMSFGYSDSVVVDETGKSIPHSYVYHYQENNRYFGLNLSKKLYSGDNVIPTSSVLIRRSGLVQVGGFDENLSFHEDRDLWIRLAEIGEVGFLDRILSVYRVSPGQLSERVDLREKDWKYFKQKHDKFGLV